MGALYRLPIDFRMPGLGEGREQHPADFERLLDRAVFLGSLADEFLLKAVRELKHLAVPVREGLLSDDCHEAADVFSLGVRSVELVRNLLVVLAGTSLSDPGVHQAG